MKRLIFSAVSVVAISCLSGCCCPGNGWMNPFGGGGGQCGMQQSFHGGQQPGAHMIYDGMQTASPSYGTPIAMPMQTYPTVALESLPTYR